MHLQIVGRGFNSPPNVEEKRMVVIGKIREIYRDDAIPPIGDLISETEVEGKSDILSYLKQARVTAVAPGWAIDVMTGERIEGSLLSYSDGEYAWRSDTIYYFERYNLKLEKEFIKHVLSQ